jgi:hypothetical protein
VCYLAAVVPNSTGVRLLQAAVLSCGLCAQASEPATNPPVALVTNVVAQRVVRDVVQTLLALTPTGNTAALGAQGSSPLSMPPAGQGSNTVWEAMVKQARTGGFTLLTNADSAFR